MNFDIKSQEPVTWYDGIGPDDVTKYIAEAREFNKQSSCFGANHNININPFAWNDNVHPDRGLPEQSQYSNCADKIQRAEMVEATSRWMQVAHDTPLQACLLDDNVDCPWNGIHALYEKDLTCNFLKKWCDGIKPDDETKYIQDMRIDKKICYCSGVAFHDENMPFSLQSDVELPPATDNSANRRMRDNAVDTWYEIAEKTPLQTCAYESDVDCPWDGTSAIELDSCPRHNSL